MMARVFRIVFWVTLLAIPTQLSGQLEPDFETRVTLKLRDDAGQPLAGVEVVMSFLHMLRKNDVSLRGLTDANGSFEAAGKVAGSLRFSAQKKGYYSLFKRRALIRLDVDTRKVEKVTFPLVMRKIIDPVGLYAKCTIGKFSGAEGVFEFDLFKGDWLPPYGDGADADVKFEVRREFRGYKAKGKRLEDLRAYSKKSSEANGEKWSEEEFKKSMGNWSARLEIKFPGEKEGIVVVDRDYLPYCDLKMPHQAYEKGYEPSRVWTKESGVPDEDSGDRGYFLRTRVKLDTEGKIVSAHYAKFIEEIKIDPRGRIEFAYVFNPTPNDRNLEFDPDKNLFGKLPMEEEVRSP